MITQELFWKNVRLKKKDSELAVIGGLKTGTNKDKLIGRVDHPIETCFNPSPSPSPLHDRQSLHSTIYVMSMRNSLACLRWTSRHFSAMVFWQPSMARTNNKNDNRQAVGLVPAPSSQ